MNGIILCEGNTDQILLSKYFDSRYAFSYVSQREDELLHRCKYKNKNGDVLHIAYVNGKNRFAEALEKVLKRNMLNDPGSVIDYIAVVMDHDSGDEVLQTRQDLEKVLDFHCAKTKDTLDRWSAWEQSVHFGEIKTLQFTLISIPLQENGALETFLLHALRDDNQNTYLVDQANSFVERLITKRQNGEESFPKKVLQSRRLQIKAPLAVYLGVTNPERTFARFEEILSSIDWGMYESINNGFVAFQSVLSKSER